MNADKPQVPTFYQVSDFEPIVERKVPRHANHECLHFSEISRGPFSEIMHYFSELSYERAGILRGEYALINGLILIRRDGLCIKANIATEEKWVSKSADEYCYSPEFCSMKREIIDTWDDIQVIENVPILSHPYSENYFHWTLETIPKIRFFGKQGNQFIVQERDVEHLFQRDLLSRTMGHYTALVQKQVVLKVRDPLLSHELLSDASIDWLRETVKIPVESGRRRIYLRRSSGMTRTAQGGGLSETPEFLALLAEFGFEILDFGRREMRIEEQVMLLDKAAVILAPHGAALTNLAYLKAPLTVIEVIGQARPHAFFLHIASALKFQYYGIFSFFQDPDRNIIVNMEELRGVLENCCREYA